MEQAVVQAIDDHLPGTDCQLSSIATTHLYPELLHVNLDGVGGDAELNGDLFVRQTLTQ